MRHFWHLLTHELRVLALAPATYVAAVLFLTLEGLFFLGVLSEYAAAPQDGPPAAMFFQLFWVPVFFMVPLLTMRSLAEERRQGTLESLMTTPVTALEVVVAKFLAAYLFYVLLWTLTLGYPWLVDRALDSPLVTERLLDPGPLWGGYLFTFTSGLLFVAVGIFASSLTRSQLVAGLLAFSILFILILGPHVLLGGKQPWLSWLEAPLEYFHLFRHLEDFSRGVVDSRPFFYYGTNALCLLGLATLVVESKA